MQDKWQRVSLEYIADVIDPQPDHRAPRFVEGGFSYIGIGDIDPDGHIRHEECRKVSEAAVAKQERAFIIEYEDIAFGKVGTVGKVVYLKEQGRYAVSATLVIIKPKDNVDRHFLFHLLQSHQTAENIVYRQTGTTRATLGIQQIRIFEYFIPLLIAEQKRIAEILDTLDETIAHTSSLITKLKYIKAGLLNDLLTRGLDENGELRDAIAHPEQFQDSPLGRIPKDWEVASLNVVCLSVVDCPHTTPIFQDEGVLIARTSNIREGTFDELSASRISQVQYRERIARLEPKPGDIIFTREAPVGEAFVIPEGMQICLGQRTMLLRPNTVKVNAEYIIAQIYSGAVRTRINQLVGGTTNPHLNVADVRNFILPVPILQEQTRIVSVLMAHNTRIREEETYLEKLKLQKKGLMHDLLTGQIRVGAYCNTPLD